MERAVEWVALVVGWTVLVTGLVALVYTLGIYTAWMVVRWVGRSPRRRAWPLLALFMEWLGASLVFLLAIPPLFRNMVRLHPGKAGGTPVLCVHGYTQNWGNFVILARRLARAGCGPIYAINVTPRFASIERVAPQFTSALERIQKETGAKSVDVVCHSMGGLVARTALARHGAAGLVRRLVTLGTPHHGTLMAHVGPGKNAVEMRRHSSFLASLPPPPPFLLSIWSTADAIVLPPDSSALEGQDVVFTHLGHFSLLLSPTVSRTVAAALTADDPRPQQA